MSLAYDPWGELSQVTGGPGGAVSFTYDFAGRRVSKTANGATTWFLYDGGELVCELNSAGNLLRSYDWGEDGLIGDHTAAQDRLEVSDFSGAIRGFVNGATGALLSQKCFTAWGSQIGGVAESGPSGFEGRYGAYTDSETGLVYGSRAYYAPSLGRFAQPLAPGMSAGMNPYAYRPESDSDDDDLGSSGSMAELYARAARRGTNQLLSMPQFQPGSKDRRQISGMLHALPIFGQILSAVDLVAGRDVVAGKQLTGTDYAINLLSLGAGGLGMAAREGGSAARGLEIGLGTRVGVARWIESPTIRTFDQKGLPPDVATRFTSLHGIFSLMEEAARIHFSLQAFSIKKFAQSWKAGFNPIGENWTNRELHRLLTSPRLWHKIRFHR